MLVALRDLSKMATVVNMMKSFNKLICYVYMFTIRITCGYILLL